MDPVTIVCLVLMGSLFIYINTNEFEVSENKKEKFTRRINNLQPLPFSQRDRDVWERRRDYWRSNPTEYSKIGTKPPEPKEIDPIHLGANGKPCDFSHTNMVPYYKSAPYKTYSDTDCQHPNLDRYTGDRPKKGVIAPFTEKGRDNLFDKNEQSLNANREREENNYHNNFNTHNSKNFEYVGGDPIRVGRGVDGCLDPDSDGVTPSGGFHPMYRNPELTRDEIKGTTRPKFDNAYVFFGINGCGVNVESAHLGDVTKQRQNAPQSYNLEEKRSLIEQGTYKKQTNRSELIRKQMKTNDSLNPYQGPALMNKYCQDIDNISNHLQPKPIKIDPTKDTGCVNYYYPTADPSIYSNNSSVTRSTLHHEPKKEHYVEKYADYNYLNDSVQKHIYTDYDPLKYNYNVHTGNDLVCNQERHIMNAPDKVLEYDPMRSDAIPKKVNEYISNVRIGNIQPSNQCSGADTITYDTGVFNTKKSETLNVRSVDTGLNVNCATGGSDGFKLLNFTGSKANSKRETGSYISASNCSFKNNTTDTNNVIQNQQVSKRNVGINTMDLNKRTTNGSNINNSKTRNMGINRVNEKNVIYNTVTETIFNAKRSDTKPIITGCSERTGKGLMYNRENIMVDKPVL